MGGKGSLDDLISTVDPVTGKQEVHVRLS